MTNKGTEEHVVLPEEINGLLVLALEYELFWN